MQTKLYILNEKGEAIPEADVYKWGNWVEKNWSKMKIKVTSIDKFKVSTVFTGLDNFYGASNNPFIFETMVFVLDKSMTNGFRTAEEKELGFFSINRYSTRTAALKGHREKVSQVKKLNKNIIKNL